MRVRQGPPPAHFQVIPRSCDPSTRDTWLLVRRLSEHMLEANEQEETAMFNTVLHTPRSTDDGQLRLTYLALMLAAIGAFLVVAIVASVW